MEKKERRAKAQLDKQIAEHKEVLDIQSKNIIDYLAEIEKFKETITNMFKDIELNKEILEFINIEMDVLNQPDAFTYVDTAAIRFRYEKDPAFVDLTKRVKIHNLAGNKLKHEDFIKKYQEQVDMFEEKINKKKLELANAKMFVNEAKQFLETHNVEYVLDLAPELYETHAAQV